jgi:hypothetical protein
MTDLNMSKQNNVDAALDFNKELEEFDRTKDRSALIKALRDQFLITRYVSGTLVEKNRLAALENLTGRLAKMPDNVLIETIETLSKTGAVDMISITAPGVSRWQRKRKEYLAKALRRLLKIEKKLD